MSPYHSDQMSQRSQVSRVTLTLCFLKGPRVSEWVSDKVTYWAVGWTAKKEDNNNFNWGAPQGANIFQMFSVIIFLKKYLEPDLNSRKWEGRIEYVQESETEWTGNPKYLICNKSRFWKWQSVWPNPYKWTLPKGKTHSAIVQCVKSGISSSQRALLQTWKDVDNGWKAFPLRDAAL